MIDRYRPFGRTLSLRQMMDRLMEDAFIMPSEQQQKGSNAPALNAYEENDNFVVEAQLPGVRPEDIDVNVEHGTLSIRGKFQQEEERQERNYMVREYHQGSFSRGLHLPETVDVNACDARFEHGVLRLVFPKSERARPQRIKISGSNQQDAAPVVTNGPKDAADRSTGSSSTMQSGTSSSGSSSSTSEHTSAKHDGAKHDSAKHDGAERSHEHTTPSGSGTNAAPGSASESKPTSPAGSGHRS